MRQSNDGAEDQVTGPVDALARLGARDRLPVMFMVVLIMACGAMVGMQYKNFGPIDELSHFDYVAHLVDSHTIPRRNEPFSPSTARAFACYGGATGLPKNLPCTATPAMVRRWQSPPDTAGGYPPAFYLPVAVVAAALKGFAGNLFVAARLAAVLILALGAVAAYLLCRTAGARRMVAFGLAVGAALSPFMLFQGSTVNPDAASMLCGAGAVLAWLRWRNRRGWWPWLGLAAVLTGTTLVKGNLVPVPVAIAVSELTLAGLAAGPWRLLSWRTWMPVSSTGRVLWASGAAVVVNAVWSLVFLVLMPPAQQIRLPAIFGDQSWSWSDALNSLQSTYTPLYLKGSFLKVLNGAPLSMLTGMLALLATSGAVAAALRAGEHDRARPRVSSEGVVVAPARAIGVVALWSLLLAAPVTYAELAASGHFIVYPGRYSLWTVPLGLAALAGVTGRRSGLLVAGVGLLIATISTVKLIGGLPA